MKKLNSYLTLEVKQRLRDMQEGIKDIPVGHIEKKKNSLQLANIYSERWNHLGHRSIHN